MPGINGSGGLPNYLPGRGFREYGSDTNRDAADWSGGARGPAAIPSRSVRPTGPTPTDIRIGGFDKVGKGGRQGDGTGQQGPISYHRGAHVSDAGAPRVYFDNVLGHGTIPWSRPTYPNIAGRQGYISPRSLFSWTENRADVDPINSPASAIPYSKKKIGNFTVRRPFGDTSSGELFRTGSLAQFVEMLPSGMNQQARRGQAQSQTHNPTLLPRSVYATAGSYGQTTPAAPTGPSNVPVTNPYGAY